MYIHVSMYATFRKLQRKFLAKNTKIFYKELKKKRKVKSIFEGKFYVQMYAKTNKTKKALSVVRYQVSERNMRNALLEERQRQRG